MKTLSISLFTIIFLLYSQFCNAKYVQTCKVKYEQEYGWSKVYEIQVTFMRGSEMNEATNSYVYNSYASYAIIFWSDEQVTTIKLSTDKCWAGYGSSKCDYDDFHGLMDNGYVEGTDLDDRKWKICYDIDCGY